MPVPNRRLASPQLTSKIANGVMEREEQTQAFETSKAERGGLQEPLLDRADDSGEALATVGEVPPWSEQITIRGILIMIIDYKLTYPSGTATAVLINSFHTTEGADVARKQVKCLGKYFTFSFLWSFFKWFFSGSGDSCGFDNFPTLGLKAFANTFYFDFSATYVGVGMICPHIINFSVMLGAVISWGIMWPYITSKSGDWYPEGLGSSDFKGLYGYKVFVAISVILGDGVYNLAKILFITAKNIYVSFKSSEQLPVVSVHEETDFVERRKLDETFMKEGVPTWIAACGYVALAAIAVGIIPLLFPPLKWYFVLLCYLVAPALAFCNAYGAGLTDWNLASTYGKLGLFIFASWTGSNGGVMAGLAACGVMMSIVSTASDLMQDFKTGYLTLSSPRSMFVSQLAGTLIGAIVAPLTFWMFWVAFDIGNPDGEYKAPLAVIFREMALIGVKGFSALPSHCLQLCCGFFAAALALNVLRDAVPSRCSRFIPIPMAMAIPFYIGAYFAIDMFVGSTILFVWERVNRKDADLYSGAVASGLICGDGMWTIPSAVLALCGVDPPICMSFTST
ncbi:hypothetical protein L7F22_020747 [Adiantum nelumboides]|nr:hypothetical protein [Adiantum nelumboides]